MKQYELTVLIHPDLEMNLQPALDKIKKIVDTAGGKIVSENNEGKRRLAYAVEKQEFAIFYEYVLDLPADGPAKIDREFAIADEVIRHLLVKVDPRKAKFEAKRKEREERAKASEEAEAADGAEASDEAKASSEAEAADEAKAEDAAKDAKTESADAADEKSED